MDHALRIILPTCLLLYFSIVVVLNTRRVGRRTGRRVWHLSSGTWTGFGFMAMWMFLFAYVFAYAFYPGIHFYSFSIDFMEKDGIKMTGFIFFLGALLWTLLAQLHMGDSWRMGMKQDERLPLVTTGVFGFTRHPIYLGMLVGMFSLFLALPNLVILLVTGLGYLLIRKQVLLEEGYLKDIHGDAYVQYGEKVKKWLF